MQDLCYLAHKGVRGQGITADSVKAWFCIRLTIYGMLKISFNASKVWYGSDIQQNDYVKKLMPHDFFRVHNRFMHFEDNEGSSVPDEDLPRESKVGTCVSPVRRGVSYGGWQWENARTWPHKRMVVEIFIITCWPTVQSGQNPTIDGVLSLLVSYM